MKKAKNKIVKNNTKKCRLWLWAIVALFIGGMIGYTAHFVAVNWHSFFVTCPNGDKPDKNGCCEGEVYTDAGDGWMVCCPEGVDNCFPPLFKKCPF